MLLAKQKEAQESRFQEKGKNTFHGQRLANYSSRRARELRPVRAELECCVCRFSVTSRPNRPTGSSHPRHRRKSRHVPPITTDGPLAAPKALNQVGVPVEATRAVVPADNQQTPEKFALGEKLFFDGRLSVDGAVACSTCHDPARAFTDGRPASVGVKGRVGQRNAPTILNAMYNVAQFWDGRAKTLEDQAGFPIINPSEMGQPSLDAAVTQIAAVPEYAQAFQHVFGRPLNAIDLERVITSYERTQFTFDSPFDHFMAGDANAISDSAKRGWQLFNTKARCNKCHALSEEKRDPTYFMDKDFHNIGIIRHNVAAIACQAEKEINSGNLIDVDRAAIQSDMSVLGRFPVTKKQADVASFKTPGLRNVLISARTFTTARRKRCGM
jgi:cytochrome c peroxidase